MEIPKTPLCNTCHHAIFDTLWGEYKCPFFIKPSGDYIEYIADCKLYKKGTPKDSKRGEDLDD